MVTILQPVHEISSVLEVLYKRSVLENFSKSTDKHERQSSGDVLSKEKMFLKFCKTHRKTSLPESTNKAAGRKPETVRSSHWRFSQKQGVFENFASFTGKSLCWSLFLIKLQFWRPATLFKKTLTLLLSCETCKLFKSNYFEEHL